VLQECAPGEGEILLAVIVEDMSSHGMRIRMDRDLPLGTPVRVDLNDNILLGEVCHSSSDGLSFQCGIRTEQALCSVTDLMRLMKGVMGNQAWSPKERETTSVAAQSNSRIVSTR
jgi:hypothetical protein